MSAQPATGTLAAGSYITANGIRTHYHDSGEGDVVLLLHGSGPGSSAWSNYSGNIPVLAQHHRVVAMDIVGYGQTERPEDITYRIDTWLDHVVGLLDALDIPQARLVGNSMGGRVALGVAHRHPERVHSMVLMGSGGLKGPVVNPTPGLVRLREYEPSMANMRALIEEFFLADPSRLDEELVRQRYEASVAPGTHEAYRAMFFDPRHDGRGLAVTEEQFPEITQPVLLVHGREDKIVPLSSSIHMQTLLPAADLYAIARCGHWAQIEHRDLFNDLALGFFARATPAVPTRN